MKNILNTLLWVSNEDAAKAADYNNGVASSFTPFEDYAIKDLFENMNAVINAALKTLSLTERLVLEHRCGLNGRAELTLEEIGEKIGKTRQGVCYIEKTALGKLRKYALNNRIFNELRY